MAEEQKLEDIPGYTASLHRSLTQPLYWMGVPRNMLLAEIFIGLFGGIIFKTFMVPVLCVACHLLFRLLARSDNQFHLVFWRSKDYKDYYDP